ncbi:MAG: hypothetical protein K0R63_1464 [Rickettsiales bacterium]|jgi:hypothetical protein|nr:hypothetical protein [Rickettsiales bacterium]
MSLTGASLSTTALSAYTARLGVVSGLRGDPFSLQSFDTRGLLQSVSSAKTSAAGLTLEEGDLEKILAALPSNTGGNLLKDLDTVMALASTPVTSNNLFSPFSVELATFLYKNPAYASLAQNPALSLLA